MSGKGATIDVGRWLRGLGLGQYEASFRENEIDEKVLTSLTQEDLKEIGVGPVGHRRRLLDAISALRAEGAPSPISSSTPPSTPPSTEATALEAAGERRHVTVMFCDLVGSHRTDEVREHNLGDTRSHAGSARPASETAAEEGLANQLSTPLPCPFSRMGGLRCGLRVDIRDLALAPIEPELLIAVHDGPFSGGQTKLRRTRKHFPVDVEHEQVHWGSGLAFRPSSFQPSVVPTPGAFAFLRSSFRRSQTKRPSRYALIWRVVTSLTDRATQP
jgi:hypothetical protein